MLYFIFVLGMFDIMIYPMLLLLGCTVFRVFLNKPVTQDEYIDEPERKSIIINYLIALSGIFIGTYMIRDLYKHPTNPIPLIGTPFPELAILDMMMFTGLMAICEEQFFRGEIFEWLTNRLPAPGLAIISSSAFFTAYHFQIYGSSVDSLLYVFVGGVVLAWAVYRSRRLCCASLAHLTNNLFSVV